ncbi:DUF1329 domain-containing protein [Pseudomonas monteilii]|jgi:hypothetical protein|uniref:DUF1329 domain-containing protein n=2 Tax=Pseudomonas putida group TaxID=136845 RepID=A0AAE6RBY7_9PSED|nr:MULTISPECIES: DUF1329 domain-containing protein [Pseudomonas]MBH3455370.1 DUF1329 domain-containing protein [Pseudomonas monteilii]MCJ7853106.1 DUF1329 domain-containing protein [Pseudomonas monteilii]MDD2124251.1 DUF1329 domain-containing protein [Pseudomonas monteilii]MDI3369144.1 DUF1329 domain-containing protein [Pseudomonas sp. V104_10]NBB03667.1 DUF1329 domain-containing protein [Pseudomonas monteilii]
MKPVALLRSILLVTASLLAAHVEAKPLLQDLTPVGADRGPSGDGRIPTWNGGLQAGQVSLAINGTPLDPYADEQPLYVITASNYSQYREQLTAGQVALLQRYPKSFRLPVYPSHRSVAVPAQVGEWARHNATSARLVNDGNGVEGFAGVVAFPRPDNGLQVLWNHLTRPRNGSYSLASDSITPRGDGRFMMMSLQQNFARPDVLGDGQTGNVLYYLSYRMTAPSRLAGDAVVLHETLDQVAQPRLSWLYSSSQRRVRRAPALAYDSITPGTAGLRTADSRDMFNGAPDLYQWTLVGKKALHVPYNSYRLASPLLGYSALVGPGHVNPQSTRYELHRVWEVVGTLKPGAKHIYGSRRYYLDEDSWAIVEADFFDHQGKLWRTAQAHSYYHVTGQALVNAMEAIYDLRSGRYQLSGLTNEQPRPYAFDVRTSASYFSPGALRSQGLR